MLCQRHESFYVVRAAQVTCAKYSFLYVLVYNYKWITVYHIHWRCREISVKMAVSQVLKYVPDISRYRVSYNISIAVVI